MRMIETLWEALNTVIKMNDKVVNLASVVKDQQLKIETLTERIIRLEATLELMMRASPSRHIEGR